MQACQTATGTFQGAALGRVSQARRCSAPRTVAVRARAGDGYRWLNKEPLVPIISFLGWFVPSNIAISALGGQSLYGKLMERTIANLQHFPVGPALTDDFWLYLITWHAGLFVVMLLGQIGVQGRKQGYFETTPRNK